jgi:hypothetical protein
LPFWVKSAQIITGENPLLSAVAKADIGREFMSPRLKPNLPKLVWENAMNRSILEVDRTDHLKIVVGFLAVFIRKASLFNLNAVFSGK